MKQHLNLFLITFLSIFICSLASADNQSSSLYNKKNDFLPADKAFKFQIFSIKGLKELDIKFNIAPGYYLYKSKLNVSTDPVLDFDLIKANGKIKEDEFFGKQEVFYKTTTIKLITQEPISDTHKVILEYQGCSEKGLCYPPVSKTINSNKINNYSHTELSHFGKESNEKINEKIKNNKDIFNRKNIKFKIINIKDNDYLPENYEMLI